MRIFSFLFILLLFSAVNSHSAVRTWDGGGADANWGTPANWVGDVAPVNGDDLVFPPMSAQFVTNNNISPTFVSFASLTIEGGNYAIGGEGLRLTNGLTVNGGTQVLNLMIQIVPEPFAPTCLRTFAISQGAVVSVFGLFIGSGFPVPCTLTLNSDGNFNLTTIFGSGTLIKSGSGRALITAASFEGTFTLNDGSLVVNANIPDTEVTIDAGITGGSEFGSNGFSGTGTVGTTTVASGVIGAGIVGSHAGILNINNALTFTANGIYRCEIGGVGAGIGGHDQLNVTGTVALNNARLLTVPFGPFRPAIGDAFVILRNDGTDPINGTFRNAPEGSTFAGALGTAFSITYQGGDGNDIVITRVKRANFDFDADGRTDLAVFRPGEGVWYIDNSSDNSFRAVQFGLGSDRIAPADYDGDNKTDIAVFRDGTWYWLNSFDGSFQALQFGSPGDIPVPSDFDGDGRADIAVYRPSTGTWWMVRSIDGSVSGRQFGVSEDKPVAGDYDGDGRGDIAVYRPSQGVWHILQSSDNAYRAQHFGISQDRPVAGDYDGDGKSDLAVFRSGANVWYVQRSSDGGFFAVQFGLETDIQTPGDYDGDGKTDIAVFRPKNGFWYLLETSSESFSFHHFGLNGDTPAPSAFVPR